MLLSAARLLVFICSICLVKAALPHQIVNLPGAPNVTFNMFSGYIVVNASHGRNLFYWFVESQNLPDTDPLVLWLNGGPGCSSLNGLLGENGPFIVNTDGKTLRSNPSAWNQIANVLYLESPSGVGFSYSKTTSDYTTGDYQTTADTVIFLQQWLLQYPQYTNNDFWITGESYGGHYVPDLALAVLRANEAGGKPLINLKGFQVGNAWTDAAFDNEGAVFDWWTHAMISDETYGGIMNNCDFAHIGPLSARNQTRDDLCDTFLDVADTDLADINIYNIYGDICTSSSNRHNGNEATWLARSLAASPIPSVFDHLQTSPKKSKKKQTSSSHVGDCIPDPDPCFDDHLYDYLNQAAVQQAIYADIDYPWQGCSPLVDYSYDDLLSSMIPVYRTLLQMNKLKMLVFSGDIDGIVPVTGSRAWLGSMKLKVAQPWRSWMWNEQVGGYVIEYDGLTFATVRDAGHMVPYTQPQRSFALFTRFLTSQPI